MTKEEILEREIPKYLISLKGKEFDEIDLKEYEGMVSKTDEAFGEYVVFVGLLDRKKQFHELLTKVHFALAFFKETKSQQYFDLYKKACNLELNVILHEFDKLYEIKELEI